MAKTKSSQNHVDERKKESKPILMCIIWATEVSPQGDYHRCHAERGGLAGQSYNRDHIKTRLETTPTWGGTWELLA